ncbi:hypothetical protein SALBM217S_07432 [Streptomyces griseoloalbus]
MFDWKLMAVSAPSVPRQPSCAGSACSPRSTWNSSRGAGCQWADDEWAGRTSVR